jgi:hypothetical protein
MKKLIGGGLMALTIGLGAIQAPVASAAESYNDDTVGQFIAMVNYETERWGLAHVPVYVRDLGDDTIIAGTQYGAITINRPGRS